MEEMEVSGGLLESEVAGDGEGETGERREHWGGSSLILDLLFSH